MKVLRNVKQYVALILGNKLKVLKDKAAGIQDLVFFSIGLCIVACASLFISLGGLVQWLGNEGGTIVSIVLMSSFSLAFFNWRRTVYQGELNESDSYLSEISQQLNETYTQVGEYVAILKGQMDGISNITEEASMELMRALYEIECSIQDSIDGIEESQKNANHCREKSALEFEMAAQRVKDIKALISKQNEQQLADNEAIQGVMREVGNLKQLTELVKNIANQTNLLALNAAIEAARAGEYGRGFAVVAEQVRILSSQSSEAAEKIEHGIKTALDAAQVQGEKMLKSTRSTDTCTLLSGFSESLENITQHYRTLERVSPKMLMCINESAKNVATKVSGAIGKIQFQDIIRQRTEHVKLEQDAIVELFGQFSTYINGREAFDETFNLNTKEMFENYVMEDQRKIHFDISDNYDEAQKSEYQDAREPKIELF